ncbi:MAG: hypothetical protein HN463_02540 [Gemmatimonadales bacterium]|nr:hypothetical protein [Gemmatimonadales bacterium]
MNRKYRSRSNGEVRSLIEEHWADLNTLGVLAYEVQHRFFMSRAYRANVVGRLLELMGSRLGALGGVAAEDRSEHHRFPTTDVVAVRRVAIGGGGDIDWRKEGLLSLSGYRVGVTRGVQRPTRELVLNTIVLVDDLSDIRDEEYAREWGAPDTEARLKKLADTLATLARNARRQEGANMQTAIREWESDLEYIRTNFQSRWPDIDWPNTEVGGGGD